MKVEQKANIYGLLAEFDDPQNLIEGARRASDAGYENMQAYTPFPIEELTEYVSVKKRNWIPAIVLIGGIFGGLTGLFMEYYSAVILYPVNVGGRPLESWASFIPITFELTVLGAALFGAVGMLALNGLPRPFHPVFTIPRFRAASSSGFFLCIKASGEKFDTEKTRQFLETLKPSEITEVFEK